MIINIYVSGGLVQAVYTDMPEGVTVNVLDQGTAETETDENREQFELELTEARKMPQIW